MEIMTIQRGSAKIAHEIKEILDESTLAEIHQICINLGYSNSELDELRMKYNPDEIIFLDCMSYFKDKIINSLTTEQNEIINNLRSYFPPQFIESLPPAKSFNNFYYIGSDLQKGQIEKARVEFFNILPVNEPRCPYCDWIIRLKEFQTLQETPPNLKGEYQFHHVECDWNERFEKRNHYDEKGMNYFYAGGKGIDTFLAFSSSILLENGESRTIFKNEQISTRRSD